MFNIFNSASKKYEDLDGASFKNKIQSSPGAELIDVRTPAEFKAGSIQGARNLDITSGEFQNSLSSMDKSREYFVFCRSGARSANACQIMGNEGFKVYNLRGGIGAWPKN